MVMKTSELKAKENHRYIKGASNTIIDVLFNSRDYMYGSAGLQGLKVDAQRSKRFLMSLQGLFHDDDGPEDIAINYLSLHQVTFLDSSVSITHSSASPIWTIPEIEEVHQKYRCDCKMHYVTGWACSHVVATMTLLRDVDLTLLLMAPPARRLPGRPAQVGGALEPGDDWYGANRLCKLFLKKPGYPVGWRVLKEFPLRKPDTVQSVAGVVKPHTNQSGVYYWTIKFENGRTLSAACEELVEIVNFTQQCGYPMY